VVARLGAQFVHPGIHALAHGRWERRWRSAWAARFTGVMRLAMEDPCLMRRATCLSFFARCSFSRPRLYFPLGLPFEQGLAAPLDPPKPRFPRDWPVLGRL
jgi:hypothetical protein